MVGFDVSDLLENLFGDSPIVASAVAPEPTVAPADRPPADPLDAPGAGRQLPLDLADDPLAGTPFAGWVRRPDSRGRISWEAPDLPEADRWWATADFDDLPPPGPACPKCGSLEEWADLLGGRHCGQCQGDLLRRGLDLLDRAEKIRSQR